MSASGFVGADPDQLEGLAASFDRAADSLDEVRTSVGGTFGRVWWEGRNGDQARGDWRGRHDTLVAAACAALREAAKSLRANAAQQRLASGAVGGSASGHGVAAGAGHSAQPGLLEGLREWGRESHELIAGGSALIFAGDLANGVPASHLGHAPVLDRLAIGLDASELLLQAHEGHVDIDTLFHTGLDVATLIPPARPFALALEAGVFIGGQAADFLQEHTHYQDTFYSAIVADRHEGPLTPSEAADDVARYSGASGYVHIAEDLASAGAHKVSDTVTSLWHSVFK